MKVKCPDCNGDGIETCHNPDHGFYSMACFGDMQRIGCPVCGHNDKHKVIDGGECDTCNGEKEVDEITAREFCEGFGYSYDEIMDGE